MPLVKAQASVFLNELEEKMGGKKPSGFPAATPGQF
jgi:hypothetical protein